jgi:hypothetical protein
MTISQTLKKAKLGDSLTDGKRIWYVDKNNLEKGKIGFPVLRNGEEDLKGFELWESGGIDKIAVIPKLKIVRYKEYKK